MVLIIKATEKILKKIKASKYGADLLAFSMSGFWMYLKYFELSFSNF